MEVFISLSAVSQKGWDAMTTKERKSYIANNPESKFNPALIKARAKLAALREKRDSKKGVNTPKAEAWRKRINEDIRKAKAKIKEIKSGKKSGSARKAPTAKERPAPVRKTKRDQPTQKKLAIPNSGLKKRTDGSLSLVDSGRSYTKYSKAGIALEKEGFKSTHRTEDANGAPTAWIAQNAKGDVAYYNKKVTPGPRDDPWSLEVFQSDNVPHYLKEKMKKMPKDKDGSLVSDYARREHANKAQKKAAQPKITTGQFPASGMTASKAKGFFSKSLEKVGLKLPEAQKPRGRPDRGYSGHQYRGVDHSTKDVVKALEKMGGKSEKMNTAYIPKASDGKRITFGEGTSNEVELRVYKSGFDDKTVIEVVGNTKLK